MEEVLRIPQISSITGTSPADCLVSYPGHSLGGGVLPLCRDAVGVFCIPSRLDRAFSLYFLVNFMILYTNSLQELVYKLGFLEVNFQPKCLCEFRETCNYFQCILLVVCLQQTWICVTEDFWSWTGLPPVYTASILLGVKASGKTTWRKIENSVEARTS